MDRNKVITKPQNLAADLGPVLALFLLGELLKEIEVLESAFTQLKTSTNDKCQSIEKVAKDARW